TTIGQLPLGASVELTVRLASLVRSEQQRLHRTQGETTYAAGGGKALALHPSTVAGLKLPVMSGAVVSWIVMVWVTVLVLLQASLTVYFFEPTTAYVLSTWLEFIRVIFRSLVQASLMATPRASSAATV